MKVTKDLLKSVVKECLIEILSEGFSVSKETSKKNIDNVVKEAKVEPRRKTADLVKFEKNIKSTSKSLTSDPVLGAIFEDTAKTTLQEQYNSPDAVVAGDRASYKAAVNDPTDLFGDAADKWSRLAFFDDKK